MGSQRRHPGRVDRRLRNKEEGLVWIKWGKNAGIEGSGNVELAELEEQSRWSMEIRCL